MSKTINLTLKVWRQKDSKAPGKFEVYDAPGIDTDMSFLEMLDVVNERLTAEGKDPIAFDHDCREGICGMCGAVINGQAHGLIKSSDQGGQSLARGPHDEQLVGLVRSDQQCRAELSQQSDEAVGLCVPELDRGRRRGGGSRHETSPGLALNRR